jgi:sec-independent protein translocase protein TatB
VFNIGGGELLVILVIALIVLGPEKLPDAVRRAGRIYGELRRMSSGFQAELRDAIDEPMKEIRSTTDLVKSSFTGGIGADEDEPTPRQRRAPDMDDDPDDGSVDDLGDANVMARVEGDRPEPLPVPVGGPVVTDLPSPNGAVPLPPPAPSVQADESLPAPPRAS